MWREGEGKPRSPATMPVLPEFQPKV